MILGIIIGTSALTMQILLVLWCRKRINRIDRENEQNHR